MYGFCLFAFWGCMYAEHELIAQQFLVSSNAFVKKVSELPFQSVYLSVGCLFLWLILEE